MTARSRRRRSPLRKSTKRAAAAPKRRGMHISDTELFTPSAPPDMGRRRIMMPPLPPGVSKAEIDAARAKAGMAFDDASGFPFAGYLNANTVAGMNAFGLYFPGYPYLAELAQRTEFRQPTETIAKEMTRKWIRFSSKGGGQEKAKQIKELEDAFEEFKVRSLFRKVTEYDGFFGLGFLYIDLKKPAGADASLPLVVDEKTIAKGSVNGFVAIEPMWCTPLVWNSTDPTHPNFYKPESWMVLGKKVHHSRLLRFVSREVPDVIKPAYNFGGVSLSQLIEPYVGRWLKTVDGVNRLINNFSIVYLQTDMDAILEGGEKGELMKRVKLFAQTRDNQGVFVTDKDREVLNQIAVPLSGLSELQAQSQEHMAAPTHLPLVVMTGITPAGLNASSDSEIEIFHDWNNSMQETLYTDPITTVSHILQLNLWGRIDYDLVYDYVPLKEVDGEAASRVYKTKADAGNAYIESGVILPEEERKRLANDPDSGYDGLSAEMPPELKNKALGLGPDGEPLPVPNDPEDPERDEDDEEDERGVPASAQAA